MLELSGRALGVKVEVALLVSVTPLKMALGLGVAVTTLALGASIGSIIVPGLGAIAPTRAF